MIPSRAPSHPKLLHCTRGDLVYAEGHIFNAPDGILDHGKLLSARRERINDDLNNNNERDLHKQEQISACILIILNMTQKFEMKNKIKVEIQEYDAKLLKQFFAK